MSRLNELRKKYNTKSTVESTPRLTALRAKYGSAEKGAEEEKASPPSLPMPAKKKGNFTEVALDDPIYAAKTEFNTGRETAGGGRTAKLQELTDMTMQERLASAELGRQQAAQDMLKDAGYIVERTGLGVATGLEGLVDAAAVLKAKGALDGPVDAGVKAIVDLLGIDRPKTKQEQMSEDVARQLLEHSATQPWQESIDKRYDPSRAVGVVGDVGQTIGNMAPSIVGNIFAPGIGIPIMGVSAGGQSAQQAYQETGDLDKAALYGAASGGLEAGTELLFGGLAGLGKGVADTALGKVVKKAVSALGDTKAGRVISGFAKSPVVKAVADSLGEGVEEVIATYLDPFLQRVIYNPNAQNATAEELLQSGLMGMLVGGVFQVGNAALGGLMGEGYVPPELTETPEISAQQDVQENGMPIINENDTAPAAAEQNINEPTRLTNSQVKRMIRDKATMEEMGIDTNGKTMRELRNEVRAALAAQEQATVERSAETGMQTPAQETALKNDSAVTEEIRQMPQTERMIPIAPQTQAEYNGVTRTEGMTNGEEVYLRNGGQRAGSAYPGGQVSAVEESAGRAESGQAARQIADRGAASLTYGERVSTASLGIGGGSIKNNIRILKSGDTQYTAEAKRIAKERGLRVYFFADDNLSIRQSDGKFASVRGYISGDRVFIRADHPLYTADQIMRHEAGHDMIAKGEVDIADVKKRIVKAVGRGQTRRVSKAYADAYTGSGMTAEEIWEEVICDSLGDMNIFSERAQAEEVGEFLGETKRVAQAQTGNVSSERGPPAGKMSREVASGKQVAWAVDNGVITEQDRVAFFRMIANISKLGHKVRRTSDGGYIVDLGNKLLFTDGNWQNPSLSSVVVFDDTSETSMKIAKDVIFNGKHNKAGYEQSRQIIEDTYWPGYVERYTERNSAAYARKDAGGEGANRGADHGGAGNKVSDITYGPDYSTIRNVMKDGKASRDVEINVKRVDTAEVRRATKQAVSDAQLAGMMNQGRKDAEKLRKAKESAAEMRRRRDETIEKLKEHQREMRQKSSESRHASDYRRRIERHVNDLSRMLRNPTDKKHVPEALRKPVAKLLESINLESAYTLDPTTLREITRKDGKSGGITGKHLKDGSGLPTKRTQAFLELKEVYANIAENMVVDPDLLGGEGTTGLLDDVIAMADKRISEMNTEELEIVWHALRAIEASIRTANKAFSTARFATISEAAEGLRSDNIFKRSKTEWNYIDKLQKLVSVDMLTPEAFFHRLGKTGDAIFRMMRNAQDKHITLMEKVAEFTAENLKDVDVRELEREMHTVKLGGQDVELSTAQIMELYALMRRQQALEHITEGGIQPDVVSKRGLKKASRAEPIHGITAGDLMEAISLLTDKETKIAELLQGFASTTLSDWGNEASMEVYGYRKFNEANYWPIRSSRQEVKSDVQKDTQVTSVANRGFTKNVKPHANNSVMVGSIFDTFASHASDMATYAAWLGTSEDVNRIRNYVFRATDAESGKKQTVGTVKGILDRVFGVNKGQQYMQKLLADIANGVKGVDVSASLTGGLMGNFKAASVGGNLRVVIQQPTAILRAFDMIDPKYFVHKPATKGFEKAKQYAPIAVWKDWGYFDIHTGRQMKDVLFDTASGVDKVKGASMWLAGKMDSVSWGILWNAVEAETKDKTDLTPGTEAFYKKVAERFNEVIDRTQVVDGILQRSQIMRDPGDLKKMVTSFMGEPTKQYNMLVNAAYDARNKVPGAKRALVRTGMALIVSGVVNAALQSIMDALRDDDREQEYWEKWLEAFVGIGADEKTAFMRYANSNIGSAFNPIAYLPYLKDVWSVIQGYDVSRMDMDGVDKTVAAAANLIKAMNGNGKQTLLGASINMLAEFGKVIGIPVANLKREIMSVAMTTAIESDSYLLEYYLRRTFYKPTGNGPMYYDILYSAYQNDQEAYELLYGKLIADGLTEEDIRKGMEKRMKKAQGVKSVDDLEQRYLSPEMERTYAQYHKELERSNVWKKATQKQKADSEDDIYQLLMSASSTSKEAQELKDKLENGARYGVSETEYLLYQLALSMADKPTDSGKYGSYTNDEVKDAIDMLGLSRKESAWLWEAQGKSKKNNPYK